MKSWNLLITLTYHLLFLYLGAQQIEKTMQNSSRRMEMFSDTFNSNHVEEVVELVLLVSESRQDQWVEVTGKVDFGSNSDL